MELSVENRNKAFNKMLSELPEKRKLILGIITQYNGITAHKISELYSIPINQVVGRITELKERCLIYESGSITNVKTDHLNTLYKSVENKTHYKELVDMGLDLNFMKKQELETSLALSMGYGKEVLSKELKKINAKLNFIYKNLEII